ncbi:MAG: SdrD B-like domain-containing protein, partial [Dolichospermum sp.]
LISENVYKSCEAAKTVTITIRNTGTGSSVAADTFRLDLPAGLSYQAASYIGLNNSPVTGPIVSGNQLLLPVKPGFAPGDSMKFTIRLTNNGTDCGNKNLIGSVTQNVPITCGATTCSTPVLTGLEITSNVNLICCGALGNYVWADANGNGLQDEPASAGINGVKVYLYKETAPGVFTVVDSTVTANDGSGNPGYYNFPITESGNYKVKFPTTLVGSSALTTQTPTDAIDGNSDANIGDGFSPVVNMDLSNASGIKRYNYTIDAGYTCTVSAGADQIVCSGATATITGLNPNTGLWTALSTNPSGATLSATTNGVATVTLATSTIDNDYYFVYSAIGCTDTMKITSKKTTSSTTNFAVCSNQLPYVWNGITFTTAGTQTATLVGSNGCDSLASLVLTVKQTSTSTTTQYICNSALPYTWNGKVYTGSTTDTVKLVNSVSCDSLAIIRLVVQTPNCNLQASYTINQIAQCVTGNSFSFTSNVTGATGALTYLWNFGDGTTSTLANPTHTYTTAGEYDVTLVVT